MFNDPGKSLKRVARIIFWLSIVFFSLYYVVFYLTNIGTTFSISDVIIFIVLLVLAALIGALIGWLASILLYAFGELIEDVHSMRKQIKRIEYKLSKIPEIQGPIEDTYEEEEDED